MGCERSSWYCNILAIIVSVISSAQLTISLTLWLTADCNGVGDSHLQKACEKPTTGIVTVVLIIGTQFLLIILAIISNKAIKKRKACVYTTPLLILMLGLIALCTFRLYNILEKNIYTTLWDRLIFYFTCAFYLFFTIELIATCFCNRKQTAPPGKKSEDNTRTLGGDNKTREMCMNFSDNSLHNDAITISKREDPSISGEFVHLST